MTLREQVFGEPGYSRDLCLSSEELSFFQKTISAQWNNRIREKHPTLTDMCTYEGIEYYHRYANQVDHDLLWNKQHRLFSVEAVNTIMTFRFMDRLRAEFGEFFLSNVIVDNQISEDQKEIYWRLVRPGMETDIGPLHADKWFHALAPGSEYGMFPPGVTTVKVWIAIYTEPKRNGLLVVPNSHKQSWRYKVVSQNGQMKPYIEEDCSKLNVQLADTEPGRMLIFHENLLHRGALNLGYTTRVSAEITMVFPEDSGR